MFKILLCILISVACAQAKYELVTPPQDIMRQLLETGQICTAESGADADILQKFVLGTYSNDPSTKRFVYCFLKKGRYADSDGNFIKENVVPIVGPHEKAGELGQAIEQCNEEAKEVNYEDEIEKAFSQMHCLHKNTPLKPRLN